MFPRTHAYCIALLLLASSAAFAQPVRGLPPFGSFSGGPFDTINNANLNAHIEIPIISKAGRGMPFSYTLTYDSFVWSPAPVSGTNTWVPAANWGWGAVTPAVQNLTGYVTYRTTQNSCTRDGHVYYYWDIFDQFYFFDPGGTSHYVPALAVTDWGLRGIPCGSGPPTPMTQPTNDGSGWTVTANAGYGYAYLSAAVNVNGISLTVGANNSGVEQDSNGNQISASLNGSTWTFKDTLGIDALTASGSGTPSSPVTLTYKKPVSGTAAYTVNYTAYTLQTSFGCSGVAEYGPTAANLVTSIALPDGSSYAIAYERTPNHPASVTGRIASITLPTGGSISYGYSGGSNGVNCVDGSPATLSRTTSDGGWAYARTPQTPPTPSTTTITDPQSNLTSLSFEGIYEVRRTVNQGASTQLEQVTTCYNGSGSCLSTTVSPPITQVSSVTSLPAGGSNTLQAQTVSYYDSSSGYPTATYEYRYGSNAPGTLVRQTQIAYASPGRPSQVTVQDSIGATAAQTNYTYDQGSVTATSNTPQHVAVTASRGNVTTVSRWVAGSTSLSQTFTYFDTGNVQTATDVNGAQTTYTYGGCINSFLTSTALPLSLTTGAAWDCNGGVQTSATDPNGQQSTTNYADPYFWRPTWIQDETGASSRTNFNYFALPAYTYAGWESALNFNNNSSTAATQITLDSQGRTHVTQTRQAPGTPRSGNYDSVETDYDSLGRPSRVTAPYTATAGGTSSGAATTTTYDALGRPLQVTDGGGGWTKYTYTQNDVLIEVGPQVTQPVTENTKKRQIEYDALGRLTSVCEITSATGSASCGQHVAQTGFLTLYTWDASDNLLSVTQNAQPGGTQQTRGFWYDGLGRMAAETHPEAVGAAYNYTYDSDSSPTNNCGTSPGDLVRRTDPVGNVTCYAYDALHRTTAVTYKAGTYAGRTPEKHFVYDASATTNTLGRLAEAYTGPPGNKITDLNFTYSPRGEVATVSQWTQHSGGTYQVTAVYWPNGLLDTLNMNLSSLPYWTYNPDGEGRAATVSATVGQTQTSVVTGTTYNGFSFPTAVTFASSDSDAFGFDGATGRMTQYQANVGTLSAAGALAWNASGSLRQLQITDTLYAANAQTCTYSHDDLARISQADCGTSKWGQSFGYDAFGNVTKAVLSGHNGTNFSPGYSPTTNRLAASNFTFDANGNLTGDGVNIYTWDAEGNLYQFNGGTAMMYDATSRRVEQPYGSGTAEILYGPDGSKLALMSGQTVLKAFVPLPGGATAIYQGTTLAWYRHADWLGSSRIASTPGQALYYDGAYSPFGEITGETTGTTDRNFTGQNQDLTSLLYDFPARAYHAGEGRWLSPDPLRAGVIDVTNPQSCNQYAYVQNYATEAVDPEGLYLGGGPGGGGGGGGGSSAQSPQLSCIQTVTWILSMDPIMKGLAAQIAAQVCSGVPPSTNGGGGGGSGGGGTAAAATPAPPPKVVKIECQSGFISAANAAWMRSGDGLTKTEAGFWVKNVAGDSAYPPLPYTNENMTITRLAIPANAIALLHTHPNTSLAQPSPGDVRNSNSSNLPFYVLSNRGLWLHTPGAPSSIVLRPGLSWLKPCPKGA